MSTIWAFVSSFFSGIGAALALTVVVALVLHFAARCSWIANALISLLLLVLSSFQFVLLMGASTVKDYAQSVLTGVDLASEMADSQTLGELVAEVPEVADYVEAGRQGLESGSITLRELVDKVLSAYMLRRWLWLGGFTAAAVAAGFLLPSRRRRRRHMLSTDFSPTGFGGGGGSSSLNF